MEEKKSFIEYYVFTVDTKREKGVVKINGKWVLVIIEEVAPMDIGLLSTMKEEITKNIRAIKEKEAMENWIDALRSKSRIKIEEKAFNSLN